jgi:hypothetical protein
MLQVFSWLGLKDKSANLNMLTVNDYYERLKLIALSLFEWENLPESCNARFLELTLYTHGRALFIYDPKLGYLNMRCTPSGTWNNYDEPLSFTAFSSIYRETFKRDECVLIRNNYIERPTDNSVVLFSKRLTDAERTIDVNINAQKTPVLVRCDDKDRLTMKNLYKDYEGNEPFILGSKSLNVDAIKVFKTDAPFVADKLQNYKHQIWNEAMTFFGVNNANTDKRERLITDEVEANDQLIQVNAEAMLLTRQEACKQINTMFPELNVSVKMREFNGQTDQIEDGKEVDG